MDATAAAQPRSSILLVGEAPNASGRGRIANATASGRRLALLGWGDLPRTNVIQRFPGRSGKGASFPRDEASDGLAKLWRRTPRRVAFVYMGRRVAAADGWRGPYLEWGLHRGRQVATFPHPSGINMWWNDPANVELARAFVLGARASVLPSVVTHETGDEVTSDQRVHARFERDAIVRRRLGLCDTCGQVICADTCGRVRRSQVEAGSNTRRWTDAELGDLLRSMGGRVSRKAYAAERKTRGHGSMPAESSVMRRYGNWEKFLDAALAS
jgi:hypothetical protein